MIEKFLGVACLKQLVPNHSLRQCYFSDVYLYKVSQWCFSEINLCVVTLVSHCHFYEVNL